MRIRSAKAGLARFLTLSALVILVLAFAGSALGFWSAGGGGTGTGATGSTTPVTLTAGTATTGLFPGGTTDVALSIANSNPTTVAIATLSLDLTQGTDGFALDATHSGCGVDALAFASQSNAGAGWTIPARTGETDGVLAVTLSGALAMSPDALSACQGATITIHLKTST